MIRRRRYSRIGLVLGGGAARGWAHIGAIRALHDAGIKPDVVCGTSIGALVGAVYANGDLDWLEEWVSRLTWQTVVRLLDLRLSGGLLGGRKVIQLFADKFNGRSIAQLNMPFAAVATELDSGRESWLQDGSVVDAVRASIAIPGIFTPVWHNGVWLVDGGLSNPVPVSVARGMRADCVIAVDLNNDILNGRDFGGAVVDTPSIDPTAPPPVSLRRNGKPWPRWLAPAEERVTDDVRVPPTERARAFNAEFDRAKHRHHAGSDYPQPPRRRACGHSDPAASGRHGHLTFTARRRPSRKGARQSNTCCRQFARGSASNSSGAQCAPTPRLSAALRSARSPRPLSKKRPQTCEIAAATAARAARRIARGAPVPSAVGRATPSSRVCCVAANATAAFENLIFACETARHAG